MLHKSHVKKVDPCSRQPVRERRFLFSLRITGTEYETAARNAFEENISMSDWIRQYIQQKIHSLEKLRSAQRWGGNPDEMFKHPSERTR